MRTSPHSPCVALRLFLTLTVSAFSSGCMAIDFTARDVPVPVAMNSSGTRTYVVVKHFSVVQDKSMFFVKRMFGGAHPDISGMLQQQLQQNPGNAIINLRIKGETREIDLALPIVVGTAGAFVYWPFFLIALEPLFADLKSYTLEGDIIRYTDLPKQLPPPPPLDPETGLPVTVKKPAVEYDPDTGLPREQPK